MKKEVTITFKTITPLWTGDAWQECKEIRPSSLIGSLRFWFEVICYFSGICEKEDFNSELGRFEKNVEQKQFRECLKRQGNTFEAKIQCLIKQKIPLPSIIFGTTGWKSLIEAKDIEYLDDYCFKNSLNLPFRICINKSNYEIRQNNDCPNKSNNSWSVFYFASPYFYGNFQVIFKVEEEIIESIFYPLLTFMDKYGFWGGKWNIGYGRLKIEEVKTEDNSISNWEEEGFEEFNFSKISNECKNKKFSDFISETSNLDNLVQKENKIQLFISYLDNSFIEIIKELIKTKAQKRAKFNTNIEERHKIFGTTNPPPNEKKLLPQGSKILPYIYEEQEQLKGGFVSIAGLLNLEGGRNG